MFFELNENHPILLKANVLVGITHQLAESFVEDQNVKDRLDEIEYEMMVDSFAIMQQSAIQIYTKMSVALVQEYYDDKMEYASMVRTNAKELELSVYTLEMFDFKEIDYLNLILAEIDEFRVLFAEWAEEIDTKDFKIDKWGLYNPKGVSFKEYVEPEEDDFFDEEDCDFDDDDEFDEEGIDGEEFDDKLFEDGFDPDDFNLDDIGIEDLDEYRDDENKDKQDD